MEKGGFAATAKATAGLTTDYTDNADGKRRLRRNSKGNCEEGYPQIAQIFTD
ncbi:MAG: hypothetical protein ABIL58_22370 [Pseudomonadota bacterium]